MTISFKIKSFIHNYDLKEKYSIKCLLFYFDENNEI